MKSIMPHHLHFFANSVCGRSPTTKDAHCTCRNTFVELCTASCQAPWQLNCSIAGFAVSTAKCNECIRTNVKTSFVVAEPLEALDYDIKTNFVCNFQANIRSVT